MAWPRRRRRAVSNQFASVYKTATRALFGPIRNSFESALTKELSALAEQNHRDFAPLLKLANERKVTIEPVYSRLGVAVKFVMKSENCPDDYWLESYNAGVVSTSFYVHHAAMYGSTPYTSLFKDLGPEQTVNLIFETDALDTKNPTFAPIMEEVGQMVKHIAAIRREFPVWAKQFVNASPDPKIRASYAAYYSNAIGNWFRALGFVVTPYVRRPSFDYTYPMTPDLNTALSIALSLKDAKVIEESYL